MPGDRWQQLANLRLLYLYLWTFPGKKLLFMGGEIAHPWEWDFHVALPWFLLEHAEHRGVQHAGRRPEPAVRARPRAAPRTISRRRASAGSTATIARIRRWRSCDMATAAR